MSTPSCNPFDLSSNPPTRARPAAERHLVENDGEGHLWYAPKRARECVGTQLHTVKRAARLAVAILANSLVAMTLVAPAGAQALPKSLEQGGSDACMLVASILAAPIVYNFSVGGLTLPSGSAPGPQIEPSVQRIIGWPWMSVGQLGPWPIKAQDDDPETSAPGKISSEQTETSQTGTISESATVATSEPAPTGAESPPSSKAVRALDQEELKFLIRQGEQFASWMSVGQLGPWPTRAQDDDPETSATGESGTVAMSQPAATAAESPPSSKAVRTLDPDELKFLIRQGEFLIRQGEQFASWMSAGQLEPRPTKAQDDEPETTATGETSSPQTETSQTATISESATVATSQPATTGAGSPPSSSESATVAMSQPAATGAGSPPSSKAVRTLDPDELKFLTRQGEQFASAGDLVTARVLFQRAAEAGDATAAMALGLTYDPNVLAKLGVTGMRADVEKARSWYQRAESQGLAQATRQLEALANR
jgi:hypothetical protein